MRIMAQVSMVMNLDKCIGCHTCSVTCKQTWTNRPGTEYVWFNNVETKPGTGYPHRYEDQEHWKGGWTLDRRGRLTLKAGGRLRKLLSIFSNPDLPTIDDYYEPWTYDYSTLFTAPLSGQEPVARPISALTGQHIEPKAGSNWDDSLAGGPAHVSADPDLAGLQEQIRLAYEQVFLFYLPRICEHCLNPSCVASCPSGAMYKREEDGIVLVDQDACRGWRYCVSGCPYKKVYFNHRSGKAEKCTLCFPRIEAGQPTICAETCVGRLRYLGLVLYDADAVPGAAATPGESDLVAAQRALFLDPHDPAIIDQAARDGIPADWITAAQRSPVYALAVRHQVALPLHPEYRTLPMVWYIPPLSPVADAVTAAGGDAGDPDEVFHAIDTLRIPLAYLASLFTAGDTTQVAAVLRTLAAVRARQRARQLSREQAAQMDAAEAERLDDLYRLLAIAAYTDRYVVPPAHHENAALLAGQAGCSLDSDGGPGMGGQGPPGYQATSFHPAPAGPAAAGGPGHRQDRFNLLGWDGNGRPPGLFPEADQP